MMRIALTILLLLAWHLPTTFFVPGGAPHEQGWVIWPFGRLTAPAVDGLPVAIAPTTPGGEAGLSLALVLAGVASLAFLAALASLWGIVVPDAVWRPAVLLGAAASAVLFAVYVSPSAVLPLLVDALLIWGVAIQRWSTDSVAGT